MDKVSCCVAAAAALLSLLPFVVACEWFMGLHYLRIFRAWWGCKSGEREKERGKTPFGTQQCVRTRGEAVTVEEIFCYG